MPPSIELGFTSSLRETLSLSRCKLDEWVEHEKAKADAQAESYRQAQTEQQQRVDRAVTHLLALQLEGGLTVSEDERQTEKNAVVKQTHAVQLEIADFEQEFEERTARVQELRMERAHQKERAQKARKTKANIELSKRTTVDDLTQGIVNYKYLGLDFEKAENERLRFRFTELDPNDPSRQFAFLLDADLDEAYDIQECDPPLDPRTLEAISDRFNESDDMSEFIRGMRRAFQDTLEYRDNTVLL